MEAVTAKKLQVNRQVDNIVSSLGELPASPAVVQTVMNITSDFNADIHDLSKALSADQALTAKVLKLSNSSFYGRSQAVATLEEAIVILGFFTLRSLIVATATHQIFGDNDINSPQHKLWEHSLATAMAARMIAEKVRPEKIEEAFIAGLMHDLGKLVFLQKMPEDFDRIIATAENGDGTFVDLEETTFGFSHADLGRVLMIKWSFPAELTDSVMDHHNPGSVDSNGNISLAHIVNVANDLAKSIEVGFTDPDNATRLSDNTFASQIGMNQDSLEKLSAELKDIFETEKSMFD